MPNEPKNNEYEVIPGNNYSNYEIETEQSEEAKTLSRFNLFKPLVNKLTTSVSKLSINKASTTETIPLLKNK